MKNLKKIIYLCLMSIILTGCLANELELNKKVDLKGIIETNEITKDNQTYKVSILHLEEPIIIEGNKINQIAIDYNKLLQNDIETTISGEIITNENPNLDLQYSIKVNNIDNILSYINTFTNKDFSVTIPLDIIKICNISNIENGFTISLADQNDDLVELFRIISVSNNEFKEIRENESLKIEKITSNKEKTIILLYSKEDYKNSSYENYNQIISNINKIKDTVVIKK